MRRHRNHLEHGLTVVFFVTLILSPWIAGLLGKRASSETENRPLLSSPSLEMTRALDREQFSEFEAFVTDHVPLRQESAALINQALFALTRESPVENAFVDRGATWTLSEDFLSACAGVFRPTDLAATIATWEQASAGTTDIVLVVAPDKSAVIDDENGLRNQIANNCQVQREQQLRDAFSGSDDLVDLWTPLRARVANGERRQIYFQNDSHWTSVGAITMAERVLEGFSPGLFDPSAIEPIESATVTGDVTLRLGWERDETIDRLSSVRSRVNTELSIEPTDGPQGVRVYTSTADGDDLITGRTVIVHDSMTNYTEAVLAPYFEHVEFIHWNDLTTGGFIERVPEADRIVFELVQRDLTARSNDAFLQPEFSAAMLRSVIPD